MVSGSPNGDTADPCLTPQALSLCCAGKNHPSLPSTSGITQAGISPCLLPQEGLIQPLSSAHTLQHPLNTRSLKPALLQIPQGWGRKALPSPRGPHSSSRCPGAFCLAEPKSFCKRSLSCCTQFLMIITMPPATARWILKAADYHCCGQ